MDLGAWCFTEDQKNLGNVQLTEKSDRDRERNHWMWGRERRGVPFSSYEKTLGFWGSMDESSEWTLLSPSAETGLCSTGVGVGVR